MSNGTPLFITTTKSVAKPVKNISASELGSLFKRDFSLSFHFTVELTYSTSDIESQSINLYPQNITMKAGSINNSASKIGILNNFPMPDGINLPTISMTLLDNTFESTETKLREWFQVYSPAGSGYMGFLEDMVGTLTYTSYDHTGLCNFMCSLPVMLDGDLTYTRDYSSNDLKYMQLDLIVLSDKIEIDEKSRGKKYIGKVKESVDENRVDENRPNLSAPLFGEFA